LRPFERIKPLFHVAYRGTQRRRLLQIGPGLLQRTLKLHQRRGQGPGLHHDLSRGESLRIDFRQDGIINGRGAECGIAWY